MENPFGQRLEITSHTANAQRDAMTTFAALKAQIDAIENDPENPHVGVGVIVPFSNDIIHVQQLGYEGRNIIFLVGERNGARVRLVLHHTQLQVLLVPVKHEAEKPSKVLYIVPPAK